MGLRLVGYSSLLHRLLIESGTDVLELLKREGTTLSAFPDKLADHLARSKLMGQACLIERFFRAHCHVANLGEERRSLAWILYSGMGE